MSQYAHGFTMFELGILVGQCTSSVERGVSTPQQAVDFLAIRMKSMKIAHKEKVWLSNRIWKGIQRAEEASLIKDIGAVSDEETVDFETYDFVDTGEAPIPVKPDSEAIQNAEA